MCSSRETIHKIWAPPGNFVLSAPAIRESIFLHVKAPDIGGCGPLLGTSVRLEKRFQGSGAFGFPIRTKRSGLEGTPVPSGLAGSAFGSGPSKVQRPSGRRPARFLGLLREFRWPGGSPAAIRGRKASSGADRPAPEAGLPCSSWHSVGRHRSNFDPGLSGRGRFSSSCWEVGRSGTAQVPQGNCAKVSQAKEGSRKGADRGPESHRASGDAPQALNGGRCASRSFPSGRDPSGPRPRPGANPRPSQRLCRYQGQRDAMPESGTEG
jgi:hypothetical protein